MSKPITLTTNSFDQWRQNTNTVSNNVGDTATLYATRGGGDNTVITQPADATAALNDQNTRKFNLTGGTVSGASTFSSTLDVTGNFKVNTNKFVVTASSGDTTVAGTLGVSGVTTLSSTANVVGDFSVATNKFNVTATNGNTLVAGTLGVSGVTTLSSTANVVGNFTVNTDKFQVLAASGNTTVAGTLGVTGTSGLAAVNISGDVAVATNKFNITATTGNTTIAGTLGVTSDVAINTNKFNITAATGNTLIAGTVGVTGLITASGGVTGAVTSSNVTITGGTINNTTIGASTPTTAVVTTLTANTGVVSDSLSSRQTDTDLTLSANGTGKVNINDLANVVGNFSVATDKFTVASATGNTVVAGTLGVTGTSEFTGIVSVDSITAKTTSGDLTLSGNGTGKVNVNDPLNAVGNFSVATDKFTVASATGNTLIAGTLGVTGAVDFGAIVSDSVTAKTTNGNLSIAGNGSGKVNVTTDFSVATNKFTVASATGNTVVAGTLNVTGTSDFTGSMVVDSITSKTTNGDLTLAGNGTGKVNINDPLNSVGDFSVATNKFNVTASSGNTTVAGTLGVTGVTTSGGVASDTVTAKTLDTDLTLSGNGTGKVNVNDPLNSVGDLTVATNKFSVTAASGNTVVGGVFSVTGTTKTAGNFYAGTTAPDATTRVNYDGHLYGTKFYGDGGGLTNLITTLNIGVDADSTHVSVPILDDRLILRGSAGVTLSYNNTEKSITFTATGTTTSSDINDNLRVGKHASIGTWTGAALQTIDAAQALEIRPWSGSSLTNLLKVASDNAGTTTVFRIAATSGNVSASGTQSFTNNTASTSTSSGALVVTGGIGVGGAIYTGGLISVEDNIFLDTNTVTGQNAQTIFSSDQDAMDVTVRCTKGTSYQFTKLLIVHNGTDSWVTEYGTVSNTTPFVTFSTSIAGGVLSLVANGGGTTNTVYKVYGTVFKD